ncbi:MAG: multicopper oxidase domain-containing protein [Gordonia sp. (in: high G+C Gram-positive bacteria)]|uniref:multicopper oxidase family protein n=1 Tax=Gordonia sp. (in: high G+C Gram-positive bacteria) TaxID=84139 RepID=UPI0039E418A5
MLAACGALPRGRDVLSTVDAVDFRTPLRIPPLADPGPVPGRPSFSLTLQAGESSIVSQGTTRTWGVNGPLLGPTLRMRRGDRVSIEVRNRLDESTTLHWHGMELPSEADGGPHQMIEPGGIWTPRWRVDQPAATLWYHPHPHGRTERHVYRGIGGMLIVDDDSPLTRDLPHEYGVDDVPVIVQDKTFDEAGRLIETEREAVGMLGDTILVNGTVGPVLTVVAERTRLRLLNASTARIYDFGFSDDRVFAVIASDGGLLAAPLRRTRIRLSPGERAEIVVRMRPGETTVLRSYPQDLGVASPNAEAAGARDRLDVLQLVAGASIRPSPPIPDRLSASAPADETGVSRTRTFGLGDGRIDDRVMDMQRIDATVRLGATEIWEVINNHGLPHNFHVHGVRFRVLDVDGRPPPPELAGWKDTVYTRPGARLRLTATFRNPSVGHLPFMYHCHLLRHEDDGMMGQFTVV